MVVTTAQLLSTKPKIRIRTGSSPAREVIGLNDHLVKLLYVQVSVQFSNYLSQQTLHDCDNNLYLVILAPLEHDDNQVLLIVSDGQLHRMHSASLRELLQLDVIFSSHGLLYKLIIRFGMLNNTRYIAPKPFCIFDSM